MVVSMVLPLANPDFSLVCNGSVKALPLTELNSLLEVAEMTRMVSDGIDEETRETMTEALLRMKSILTQDSHATRRTPYAAPSAETRESV